MITVNKNKCPKNHKSHAVAVCPVKAISQDGFGLPVVDNEKCINCLKCIRFCPMGAIETRKD